MDFEIDSIGLDKNYLKTRKGKKEFKHSTNKNFKLLPFVTQDSKIRGEKNNVKKDLTTFQGIAGECYRMIHDQKRPDQQLLSKEQIINKILSTAQVKPEDKPQIETILNKVAFDSQNNLFVFDEDIFSYINFQNPTGILETISLFFYTIFFDENLKDKAAQKTGQQTISNIYYQLILSSLPEVKSGKKYQKELNIYQNFLPEITEMFRQDLAFMLADKNFFITYFPLLLKYYYFTYLKQLTLSLNYFFDDFSQSIFFTLEWETLSSSRISHQNGWSLFESKARNIFSFVNFFELISYINYKGESFFKGNFQQIKAKIETLTPAEQTILTQKLEEITDFYQQKMEAHMDKPFRAGSSWADFEKTYEPRYNPTDTPIYYQLHKLWATIDYQFIHSERDSPYNRYQAWITEFCKLNFVRNRGRLGQSLSLDQPTLLFITKLCLGKRPKIRLKNLWVEYNKRGLFFDPSSQKEIVKLFEKINLLEKKSDSGDAQYVKTIQ